MKAKPAIVESQWHQDDFIQAFQKAQSGAYQINVANGWWDDRNGIMESGSANAVQIVTLSCLGLVTSEVAEAMEAARMAGADCFLCWHPPHGKRRFIGPDEWP